MKRFEVKGFHKSTVIDKFWFYIEAETEEEALAKAKITEPDDWIDSKSVDVLDGEYIDQDEWTIVGEEEIDESKD